MFGTRAMTYAAEPDGDRLAARLPDGHSGAPGPSSRLRAHALAWGDLVMYAPQQLLTLKALAERDVAQF